MQEKVRFKRIVNIDGRSSGERVFCIIEKDGEFYVYRSSVMRGKLFGEHSILGIFKTYQEAKQFLKQELGIKFPSFMNKVKRLISRVLGLLFICFVIFFMISFIQGGFKNIGINDFDILFILTFITFIGVLGLFISWYEERKKKKG